MSVAKKSKKLSEKELNDLFAKGSLTIYHIDNDGKIEESEMRELLGQYFNDRRGRPRGIFEGIILWIQFPGYKYYVGKYWPINGGDPPLSGEEWICDGEIPSTKSGKETDSDVEIVDKLVAGNPDPISFKKLEETLMPSGKNEKSG